MPVPVDISHSVSASGTSESTRKPDGLGATYSLSPAPRRAKRGDSGPSGTITP
jgi:hypothetical protein